MICYQGGSCGAVMLDTKLQKPKSDRNYLYFQAEENGATVWLTSPTGSNYSISLEISMDGSNWSTWTSTTSGSKKVFDTITLETRGDYVFIRAVGTNSWAYDVNNYVHFSVGDKKIAAGGNIISFKKNDMSNINSISVPSFAKFFCDCKSLTTPPELYFDLPLGSFSYNSLFIGCTSLTTAPALPATTMKAKCYESMFEGCTSLTRPPELPASAVTTSSYSRMFYGCTNLTIPPELPATTLGNYCYNSMFYGCTSLTTPPELPATALTSYCYQSMFYGCTSLTTPPVLPATGLADSCYCYMFYDCTSLATAPALPAMSLAKSCYEYMFYGCISLMTAPELPATALTQQCYDRMFMECISLTSAPILPATTLVNRCYMHMFYNCHSLNKVKVYASSWDTYAAQSWLYQVQSYGTFDKPLGTTITTNNSSGIPSGWQINNF